MLNILCACPVIQSSGNAISRAQFIMLTTKSIVLVTDAMYAAGAAKTADARPIPNLKLLSPIGLNGSCSSQKASHQQNCISCRAHIRRKVVQHVLLTLMALFGGDS